MAATILGTIFWFVVTFSILVILHEGGHFLVARLFGAHVHEFMIGLPGPALRVHGKETDYGITAISLGGYVRISGMEPGPEDPNLGPVLAYVTRRGEATADEVAADLGLSLDDADLALDTLVDWNALSRSDGDMTHSYVSKHAPEAAEDQNALLGLARSTTYRGLSRVKRILVLSAGVVVNLVAAILVFVLVLALVGLPTETLKIDVLSQGGGAAKAGLKIGETIQAIDGAKIADWEALVTTIGKRHAGDVVRVTLTDGGSTRVVPVTLGSSGTRALLGVQGASVNVPLPLPQAFSVSFGFVGQVFQAIAGFFNPRTFQKSVQNSTGVVGIAVMANQEAQRGPIDFAFFVALLSLSLGAMNILPIPPLDGGKVALEIIEAVSHRQLPRNVSIAISLAGTVVLVALIGYLMYADVTRIITRG